MLNNKIEKDREQVVEEIKEKLLRRSWPRLLMALLIFLTGLTGLLTSFVMLHLGFTKMWLRYPLAILAAYGVFLLLLRFWIWLHQPKNLQNIDVDFSGLDFDIPTNTCGGSDFSLDLDLGDALVVLLVLVLLFAVLIAVAYVIYVAPVLLAEILVDGLFVSSLALNLKETERRHWLGSAFRQTWVSLSVIIVLFVIIGAVLQWSHPEARSIVEWWQSASAK